MTEEDLSNFEKRYTEGHDIVDNTASNKLWRTYRMMRDLDEGRTRSEVTEDQEDNDSVHNMSVSFEVDDPDSVEWIVENQVRSNPTTSTPIQELLDERQLTTTANRRTNLNTVENPVSSSPSTSTPRQELPGEGPSTSTVNRSTNAKKKLMKDGDTLLSKNISEFLMKSLLSDQTQKGSHKYHMLSQGMHITIA